MCRRRHDYERGGIIIIIIIIRRNLNALVRPDARPGQGLLERVAQRNRLCAARRQVALAGQGGTRRRLMHQPCCLRSLRTLARLQASRQPRHDIRATIEITERRADPLAVSAEHSGRCRQSRRLRARHGSELQHVLQPRVRSAPNVGPRGEKSTGPNKFWLNTRAHTRLGRSRQGLPGEVHILYTRRAVRDHAAEWGQARDHLHAAWHALARLRSTHGTCTVTTPVVGRSRQASTLQGRHRLAARLRGCTACEPELGRGTGARASIA